MNITNSTIYCKSEFNSEEFYTLMEESPEIKFSTDYTPQIINIELKNQSLQSQSNRRINSVRNVFRNCYVAPTPEDELIEDFNGNKLYPVYDGGIFNLKGYLEFYDEGSKFTRLSAINGAVLWCDSCLVESVNTVYDEIICDRGCVFYSKEQSNEINFTNAEISGLQSKRDGSIAYIQSV